VYLYSWIFGVHPSELASCVNRVSINESIQFAWNILTIRSLPHLLVLSSLIALMGVTIEKQVGSERFLAWLIVSAVVLGIFFSRFAPRTCFPGSHSLGPVLASTAVLAHAHNPKVSSEGFPWRLRLPFNVEARWYIWSLLLIYTLGSSATDMLMYQVAIGGGMLFSIKSIYRYMSRVADRGFLLTVALLYSGLLVFPFSVSTFTDLPFNGPVLFHQPPVRDMVSGFVFHLLNWLPVLVLSDRLHRLQVWLVILIVLGIVYAIQWEGFSLLGPGIGCLMIAAYRIIVS
jgi:hypothetical protein